jgi:hypothetical protein
MALTITSSSRDAHPVRVVGAQDPRPARFAYFGLGVRHVVASTILRKEYRSNNGGVSPKHVRWSRFTIQGFLSRDLRPVPVTADLADD